MAYSAGNGMGRAKLFALQSLIQDNIGGLNDALLASSDTSFLVTKSGVGQVLVEHVKIGKLQQLWNPRSTIASKKGGALRICVCQNELQTYYQKPRDISGGEVTFQTDFNTSIMIPIHPEMIKWEDPEEQGYHELMVTMVIEDWFRAGLFANHQTLTLTSNEFGTGADELVECYAESGEQGVTAFSFGSAVECPTVHIMHKAKAY